MINTQVIYDDEGNSAFAVIPWLEYIRLVTTDTEIFFSDEELYDYA